ncbi:MAG: carboxypeptidase-like regulatory domain-containing protein [Butyricimonas faecihominis]
MKKSKKYFVFWDHCTRGKTKLQWRYVYLMCVVLLMLPFVGRAQQQKVTVRVNKAGVQEVFRQIKEQAGLNFVYDKAQVTTLPPVTLTMQGVTVDAVLKRVFQGSPFEYIYENSTVVIKKRAIVPQKPGEVVIRGVVSDQDGNTIPGVSVVLKGTTLGTASDADGKFALALPSLDGVVLTFTCIGMKTREMTVKDARTLNVTLEEDSETIQEVVVTGIYSRNKESFTGSFATYSKEDLKMIGSQNVIQSGLDPSMPLESKQWGSDPNRMPDINRGKTVW